MCWSGAVSATLAVAGTAGAVYFYRKGEPKALCVSLLYFTLIEFLQTWSYLVVDECQNPANVLATTLSYLHVSLQPFFFNALALHFIPEGPRRKIQPVVYSLCAVASAAMLVRIMPLDWDRYCYQIAYYVPFMKFLVYQVPFCGVETCSTSGSWHIEWAIKAGYNWYLDRAYFYTAFLLPLLYGSWRAVLYGLVAGPGLALLTSSSANEFAAVWCLYSVGLILLLMSHRLRNFLSVRSFYGTRLWNNGKPQPGNE